MFKYFGPQSPPMSTRSIAFKLSGYWWSCF